MFKNIKFKIGNQDIKGAGGGGSAPQPEAGNVTLKPPTLDGSLYQSVAYLSVLDLISDGPLDGFSNPIDGTRAVGTEILSSIYYDDLPLKQPTKRNISLVDIKGSSIRNVGIFANDANQPTAFGNIIEGLIDGVEDELNIVSDSSEAKVAIFSHIDTEYDIEGTNTTVHEVELDYGGKGYVNNFNFPLRFTAELDSWTTATIYCFIGPGGTITGINTGGAGFAADTLLEVNLPTSGGYGQRHEWTMDIDSIPTPSEVPYDENSLQLENYRKFLYSIKSTCTYDVKSPLGYIQYDFGENFDFGGAHSGIKMYNTSKGYLVNSLGDSQDLYERNFKDHLNRSYNIPSLFYEGSFKVDLISVGNPPVGRTSAVYNVTGLHGSGLLFFYIGTGEHSGAGGSFLTEKFLTTDGNTEVIDAGTNNGYDVFVTGDNYIKLASENPLQTYPLIEDVKDKNIRVGFFTENFENLNFNNISVDYILGEDNQNLLGDYSSGTRDYNINHRLYGSFVDQLDSDYRDRVSFTDWNEDEGHWRRSQSYDEFSYTHIIQQREVGRAVPTIAIQQLSDTIAYSGDIGYNDADGGNVGSKRDSTLTLRLEYGFEGDRIPLGYEYDGTALGDGLISGAAAQGIDPQSLVLSSFRKITDVEFKGIIESPFYRDLEEIEDLPKNKQLENLTYGDVLSPTQAATLGVNLSDIVFPNEAWKDVNRYVKVKKVEPETESILIKRSCSLHSITEYINSQLSYPFSAAVGNRVDARSFSQAPNRTYLMKMKKVKIPSNYYPLRSDGSDKRFITDEDNYTTLNQIYYGEWDGTFRFAWTDNPAWILYDLITNTRYGIGNQIDDFEDVDIFELYIIGRYCDAVDNDGKFVGVKDGRGGLEPRFTCNIAIDQKQNAFQLIGNIAAIFRGMVYWNAGTLNFSVDRPKPISAIFNNENAYDGMFTYSDVSAQNRFTRVTASYMDKNDDYKMKKEYVDDEEAIRNYGLIIKDVDALGCTSRSQARRMAKYVLLSNKLETEAVQFKTDARALTLSPGDIIRIDDELKHFEINYGKVLDVNVLNGYIDIDNQINTGNIALGADSALYLYNDSMDQNDLRTLYDISKYNDNGILAGESLTLAAMNNQDTHNLIAKLGEQYTGFSNWDEIGSSNGVIQGPFDGNDNQLFSLPQYETIKDDDTERTEGIQIPINLRVGIGDKLCLSIFTKLASIGNSPYEGLLYRFLFNDGETYGFRIEDDKLVDFIGGSNISLYNSGYHEIIRKDNGFTWHRPYATFEILETGIIEKIQLFYVPAAEETPLANPNGVEIVAPQLEFGDKPTPFNSNNFQANNFINKFTVTGVGPNGSSNGYRLYVDKDTVEYSTFNEVPIGSYFNVKLDNQIDELYKIIKISPDENNLYAIEGLQYYSGKFDQIENLDFSDYSNLTNIGIPINTITRPAPVLYPELIYYSAQDGYGLYYLSIDVSKLGLSSAEKYRVTMISPNGSYLSKEVSIEEEGATNIRFNNLIAGEYTVYVASIRNPESKVIKPKQIKIG